MGRGVGWQGLRGLATYIERISGLDRRAAAEGKVAPCPPVLMQCLKDYFKVITSSEAQLCMLLRLVEQGGCTLEDAVQATSGETWP